MKKPKPKVLNAVKKAALPLMKYLAENQNPHCKVIVTSTGFELVQGVCAQSGIMDFIKD